MDRHAGAGGQREQRRGEAALAEHRRVQRAGDVAQRGGGRQRLGQRFVDQRGDRRVRLAARDPQLQGERDEMLVRTLVQPPLQAPPRRVGRLDEPHLGVRDPAALVLPRHGERQQHGEVGEAVLAPAGIGSSPAVGATNAPHTSSPTRIGAAIVDRRPIERMTAGSSPWTPS